MTKVVSIIALAFGLAACGGDDSDQTEETVAPEEGVATEQDIEAILDTENIPDVIATVNGEDINKDIYVANLEQQASQLAMQGFDLESEEGASYLQMVEDSLIQQIINERLIIQAANEEDIQVTDEEIDKEIEQLIGQMGMETEEQLQELLDEQGVTMEELRADVIDFIKRDKYIETNINVTSPSEEELQSAYDERVAMVDEETEVPDFEDYKDELEYNLVRDREQEQTVELLENLREDSEITIHI
ncbi:SurA N-terminal domain-containing protein [Halalkalibacter krulwichiae]|uniref:peptidylprolyl isomerase n=1 Tax=Halalkalibacter krulwichiae TaxID=199441 RepID=A0A1X9MFD6_9BACI|nr:SurA N-terminal domain-containing protein [Halalkalibacter krulwichiae]ARK30813.1 peptidylprolyl isomerase [Halalkalibacter krulwichiae]